MTVSEVVATLEREAAAWSDSGTGLVGAAYEAAAKLVRDNLVPQWQDEPDGDGWHLVRGIDVPCFVERTDRLSFPENGEWSFTGFGPDGAGYDYRPLDGRQVCLASPPPPPKTVDHPPSGR